MSTAALLAAIAGWLLTVALHGALFLSAAWLIDRFWRAPPNAWRELMWRVALFGGVISASLQPLAGPSPLAARWQLGEASAVAAVPAATGTSVASSFSIGPRPMPRLAGPAAASPTP